MRRLLYRGLWLLVPALLVTAGCSGLNKEISVDLDPKDPPKTYEIEPPKKDETITVDISSPNGDVSVYLIKEEDRVKAEEAINAKKHPPNVLGEKENVKDGSFQASVKAGEKVMLMIATNENKKIHVTIKLKGS